MSEDPEDFGDQEPGDNGWLHWSPHHKDTHRTESDASHDASRNYTKREQILRWFLAHGPATDWECQMAFGWKSTGGVNSSRGGAVKRGYMVKVGERVNPDTGKMNITWGFTPLGRELFRLVDEEGLSLRAADARLMAGTEFAHDEDDPGGPPDPPDPPGGTPVPSRGPGGPSGPPRIVPERAYPEKEITL